MTMDKAARDRVHDAIRRAIFAAGACDMMIGWRDADALYERCKAGKASVPAYAAAEWNAIAATDDAIKAVLAELNIGRMEDDA